MRRLVLIRHAKAQRTAAQGDHARALTDRGRAQALALREWTNPGGPLGAIRGIVVVSDAARTLETFELALDGTPLCTTSVVDRTLYNGVRDVATDAVLDSLAAVDPGEGDLIVVGHNPTVAIAVRDLVEDPQVATTALFDGYPLCAAAVLTFDGEGPRYASCELAFFGAPTA